MSIVFFLHIHISTYYINESYIFNIGRLLYCLQFGILVSILNDQTLQEDQPSTESMAITKKMKMEQLGRVQKEAEAILSVEVDESTEEYRMLKTLRGELKLAGKTIHL